VRRQQEGTLEAENRLFQGNEAVGEEVQVVECLCSKHKALSSNSCTTKKKKRERLNLLASLPWISQTVKNKCLYL
jgi:hypothetical protein